MKCELFYRFIYGFGLHISEIAMLKLKISTVGTINVMV